MDFILEKSVYIGILGKDAFDLTVYLSMVLKNLHYNVSVADISKGANFFLFQQASCTYSYKNIDFYRNDISHYGSDIVLVLADEISEQIEALCGLFYIVTDNSYAGSQYLKAAIRQITDIEGVIFRDVTDNGITPEYIIRHIIKDDYLIRLSNSHRVYKISDDVIDREYKVALGYEGITDFKKLSGEYLKVLSEMALRISGKEPKAVEKALEKAKEGEIIEYSILE